MGQVIQPHHKGSMKTQIEVSQADKDMLSALYTKDAVKACRKALAMTRSIPENDRLDVINDLLGMHGTEAIRGEWQNGYWCDIVACYCNTGDTYATTVIQVRGEFNGRASRFFVSTMGDWVERNSNKYGIE
jgi:hypothetical protein